MLKNSRFLLILPILFITLYRVGPTNAESAGSKEPIIVEAAACSPTTPHFIKWSPVEKTCPVCKTKNTFMEPLSYGSYIYSFPSKYQLIFWPHTDSASWYSCKKCKLTLFMGDFENIPKDKIAEIQKALEPLSLPAQKNYSNKEPGEGPPYLGLPVAARLVVAEKIYQVLGSTDEFWSHFYRVFGYHLDHEGKTAEAAEARRKALNIVEGWLTDPAKEGLRKEYLYICGAMRHFLNDDAGANKDFEAAAKLKYSNSDMKPEQNENYNEYLDTAIKEYIELIKKGKVPRG